MMVWFSALKSKNSKKMRSIERRFEYIQKRNPYWSSFTCFANTIRGQKFSEDRIRRYFNELVDKEDYAKNEKGQILNYLYEITKDGL